MTATDLATLEAKATKAQAALAAAQAAAEKAREQEQARQAARARQLDEDTVNAYDEQELFRAIRAARQDFDRALAASDLGRAWIALKLAEARHAHAAEERNGAAARLGRHDDRVPDRPAGNATFDDIGRAVDRIVADLIAAELDARDAARQAAITGREEGSAMALDALDPGPNNDFPYFPRDRNGTLLWSRTAATDGQPVEGVVPMPTGARVIRRTGVRILTDVTPRKADGTPVDPPTLAPTG